MPTNYNIDKVDRQILTFLIEDARTPFTEIAKKLNISPGTVHGRVKKMGWHDGRQQFEQNHGCVGVVVEYAGAARALTGRCLLWSMGDARRGVSPLKGVSRLLPLPR